MSIIVFMDGVLRTDTRVPIFEGLALYKALNADSTVLLACEDEQEATRWCKEHRLNDVDGLIGDDRVTSPDDKNWAKIQAQQAAGRVYFVITSDIDLAHKCLESGIRVLAFLHPIYLSAKFRPDGREGRRSWDAVVGELDKQINMLMEDDRL